MQDTLRPIPETRDGVAALDFRGTGREIVMTHGAESFLGMQFA